MGSVLFKIGSLSFFTYGVFMVLAMLIALTLMYWLAKKVGRSTTPIFDLVVFSLLVGIIFARVTYFIIYREQFTLWTDVFRIWEGGLVSWGGFIAGLVCYLLIVRAYREPILTWLDILGISTIAGISVGRVGSFLSGEMAGKPSQWTIAVGGLLPATLIEAIILFLIFLIFALLFMARKINKEGYYFLSILMVYSFVRFILDFIRTDNIIWLGLTYSQIVSAIIIVVTALFVIIQALVSKKGARHA